MWSINGQLQFLCASSLDDAHRTLEEKEDEANVFAWWSYVLYFISGVLALGGKMAGIETVGA
jgi:fatty acid desaturase